MKRGDIENLLLTGEAEGKRERGRQKKMYRATSKNGLIRQMEINLFKHVKIENL